MMDDLLSLLVKYEVLGTVEELSELVKARDERPKAGDDVYVLYRNEHGEAVGLLAFIFLAVVGQGAILSRYIDDIYDLENTIEYYICEPKENRSTNLYVYPAEDVYSNITEAEVALRGGKL